jgi:hypothetical protein
MSLLGVIVDLLTHFYNFNEHAGMILFSIEMPYDTGLVTFFINVSHFAYMTIFYSFLKSYFEDSNLLSTSIALIPLQN